MTIVEIEPSTANEILMIQNIDTGVNIDGSIYVCSNEIIRMERTLDIVKLNYLSLSSVWQTFYAADYAAWISGSGSGIPGDPNEFYITANVIILGRWKIFYHSLTPLLTLLNTL